MQVLCVREYGHIAPIIGGVPRQESNAVRVTVEDFRLLKQMLLAGSGAFFFLVTAIAFSGLYGLYTSGRVATSELVHYLVKGTTTLLIGLLALSML